MFIINLARFELRTSGVGSNCSTNWATTTAPPQITILFQNTIFCHFVQVQASEPTFLNFLIFVKSIFPPTKFCIIDSTSRSFFGRLVDTNSNAPVFTLQNMGRICYGLLFKIYLLYFACNSVFCWHCHTASHSTTPHPIGVGPRGFVTLWLGLWVLPFLIINGTCEIRTPYL